MFTEISMKNFKSWRDTGPVRMAPLTAFFGANSSGKSGMLQMLLLLKQTAESNDRNLVLKTGGMQEGFLNLGTPHEITSGEQKELSLGFRWNLSAHRPVKIPTVNGNGHIRLTEMAYSCLLNTAPQRTFVKELRYSDGNRLGVCMSRAGNNRYSIQVRVLGQEPNRPQSRPRVYMSPEKCYGFSAEAIRFYRDTGYLRDLEYAFEDQLRRIYYLGPLREYPQRVYSWSGEKPTDVGPRGELAVHALLAGSKQAVYGDGRRKHGRLRGRIAEWLRQLNLAASFDLRPVSQGSILYNVWLRRQNASPEALLPDLGIGLSQVLPVLTLCYYVPQGSTIILEHPELHLHPAVQAGLADVFIDVIKNRDVQLIIESHSEHLLRRLQRRIAEEKLNPSDAALYFCQMRDGESKLTKLDVNLFGEIHNWPEDFFGDLTGDVVNIVRIGRKRKARDANAS